MPPKQIICINWGTKYGALYVNRLYGMVARNVTPPFTFTCFTDNSDGFRDEVDVVPLPELDFQLPVTRVGIWSKCRLWSERLAGLTGVVLFLDLDLVVTGNLDGFFEFGEPDDVMMAKDPSTPLLRYGQTSIYRFPVGKLLPLLTMFAKSPRAIAEKYRYEQRYVSHNAPGGVKFWPKPWVLHFRRHCRRPFPLNYFLAPKLPATARVVIFPADPKPADAIVGIYYSGRPIRTPIEHLKAGMVSGQKRFLVGHLRHYILPTSWVESHWRE